MTSAAGGLNSSTQKPLAGSPARMRAFSDRFTTRSLRSADPGAPAAAPLRSLAASPAPAIGPGARGGEAVMPPRNRSTAGLFLALTRPQAPPAVGAIQTKKERRPGDRKSTRLNSHH